MDETRAVAAWRAARQYWEGTNEVTRSFGPDDFMDRERRENQRERLRAAAVAYRDATSALRASSPALEIMDVGLLLPKVLDELQEFIWHVMCTARNGVPEPLLRPRLDLVEAANAARRLVEKFQPRTAPESPARPTRPLTTSQKKMLVRLRRNSGRDMRAADLDTAAGWDRSSERDKRNGRRDRAALREAGLAEKVRNGWWRALPTE